ncbi:MAG: hypothetical protein AB7S38_29020 [Vulcanimicrobiota bacterium]
MGNFQEVSLGNGALSYNGVDVGFLKGDVTLRYNYDILDFKTGIPLKLQGSINREIICEIEAGVAQLSAANMSMALGGLTIATTGSTTSINDAANQERTFGGSYQGSGIEFILLDGPSATSLVIKNTAEDTTYTAGTDYLLLGTLNVVIRLSGGSISSGQTVRVAYDYQNITGKQINLGNQVSLAQVPLVFTHTRPNGKLITVNFWKASVNGQFENVFSESDFIINRPLFRSVADEDNHPSNPMGYALFEE